MPENHTRLTELLNRYANGTSTQVEENELFELLNNNPEQDIEPVLMEILEKTEPDVNLERRERILEKVWSSEAGDHKVRRLNWRRIAVAASIVLAVGLGSYFMFFNKAGKQTEIVKGPEVVPGDVKAPETNRAMITLADGRVVPLDSISSGTLISQDGINVIKTADGKIEYRSLASLGMTKEVYNTLSNPRGSKVIDMTLSDGSHVWLNAGSSVTYPVAFVGNERKVSITGEAYFEVAPLPTSPKGEGKKMPFIVSKGDMSVTVLGTHFNVNAYEDENDIRVTLLEGSVKVSNKQESLIIKPNQQAVRRANGELSIVNNVNTEQVMAWKNGKFYFGNKADIQTIMRQIGRWYDVEVKYSGALPKQEFGGEMPRSSSLAQVMEILRTSGLQFSIDGKSVTIGKK